MKMVTRMNQGMANEAAQSEPAPIREELLAERHVFMIKLEWCSSISSPALFAILLAMY